MNVQELEDYYRKASNEELAEVLLKAADFRPDAVKAAAAEWALRGLPPWETVVEQMLIKQRYDEYDQRVRRRESQERRWRWLEPLNPWRAGIDAREIQLRWMSFSFVLLLLISFVAAPPWELLRVDGLQDSWLIVAVVVPLVIKIAAAFFFSRRQKIGWFLLVLSMSLVMVSALIGLFYKLRSDTAFFMMPGASTGDIAIQLIISFGFLYAAFIPYVLEAFGLPRKRALHWMILAFALAAPLAFL